MFFHRRKSPPAIVNSLDCFYIFYHEINISVFLVALCFSCHKNVTPGQPSVNGTDDILPGAVNLSNWFNDYSDPAQFSNRFSLSTLKFIKSHDFTYVRIPVGVTILFNARSRSVECYQPAYVDAADG